MKSLSVGHFTNVAQGTGVTVFLLEKAKAAYTIPGSAPASRELAILDLESNIEHIDAIVFSGGSAYGLGAANGVMQWLQEQGRGKKMPNGVIVPIVAAAAIYNLTTKESIIPSAQDAYQACRDAKSDNHASGQIGAGTGASVGKIIPNATRMMGGFGSAKTTLSDGLEVVAHVVVNAVGDVRDASGAIIAGAKLPNGKFADCRQYLLNGNSEPFYDSSNTTLVAVFTNADFSRPELKRIAKMATAGIAEAISPIFTRYDGDTLFCVSSGNIKASELTVGMIAVETVRKAIVNAVS